MIANMAHGGRIALLGIPPEEFAIDWNAVVFNMLTIKGIYGREMYETWYAMSVMLQSGLDISPVITHRFGYARLRGGVRHRAPSGAGGQGHPATGGDLSMYVAMRGPARRAELDEIRAAGLLQGRARDRLAAAGRTCASAAGEVLNLCANNYLGLADHPGADRGGPGGARPLGLRHGVGALHLRHAGDPQGARGAAERVPRHRGHDPLRLLLRRQRRAVRDAARRRRTRSSPTRSTTPRSSTASGSARRSASATRTATWTSSSAQLKETHGRAAAA